MSNIADRAAAAIDRIAGDWLTRMGGAPERLGSEVAVLRRLSFSCIAALLTVPAGLSLVASPALALPVGVALVLATFLLSAAGAIALSRLSPANDDIPGNGRGDQDAAILDALAGLVLIVDVNGHVGRVSGRDRETFPEFMQSAGGQLLAEMVHVSDRIAYMQALDTLRRGENAACVDIRIDRPHARGGNGQFLHVRMDMTAVRGEERQLQHVLAQLRDISREEQLRIHAAEKASEAELANDAKSRFLAAVSHELRTPLNAILGFSDILAGEYFGRLENDRQREYVKLIRQSGAHLLSVVNTMLDMSKIEAGRYELMAETFLIAESMQACEAMLGLQAKEKGVTLTSRVQRDIGEVVADQRAIQQVLINLAGNAIKFTEAGGVVSLDASLQGRNLVISVSDTGIGIPDDKIELLGQPFVQVQNDYTRRYEGTGLGLSLVKGLVALHGGSFAITSHPGEGTVVTVTIPADGSGVVVHTGEERRERTVEFPPRLKNAAGFAGKQQEARQTQEARKQQEETVHGAAQAKIA